MLVTVNRRLLQKKVFKMPDKFLKEKRSLIMSKIRSKNTKIEVNVFRELRKRGIYFQKHYKGTIGNPDIALPRKKKAIFIDGDFGMAIILLSLRKNCQRNIG